MVVGRFLYIGNLRPNESTAKQEWPRRNTISCCHYYSGMGRWDKAIGKVEELTYGKDPNDLYGHYFDSRLRVGPHRQVDRSHMTLEESRDYPLREKNLM